MRKSSSVDRHYIGAAIHWLHAEPLYDGTGSGFLYLPQAAILHIPFALLPRQMGAIAWRLITIGVYAMGLYWFCSLSDRRLQPRIFLLATLVSLPICVSAARNGQTTLLMTGLMMLTAQGLASHRWTRSAFLLSAAFAFKPAVAPYLLIVAVLHRALLWRLAIGMGVVALLPYLTQPADYVTSQYLAFGDSLRATINHHKSHPYAHLAGAFEAFGWRIPRGTQSAANAVAAAATLWLTWYCRSRLNAPRFAMYCFTVTVGYLLLFNPRTENNTYAMLAPAMGLFFAESVLLQGERRRSWLLAGLSLGMLGSYEFAVRLVPGVYPIWLSTSMGVWFLILAVRSLNVEIRTPRTVAADEWFAYVGSESRSSVPAPVQMAILERPSRNTLDDLCATDEDSRLTPGRSPFSGVI